MLSLTLEYEKHLVERGESMLCDQHIFEGEVDIHGLKHGFNTKKYLYKTEETFLSKEDRRNIGFSYLKFIHL